MNPLISGAALLSSRPEWPVLCPLHTPLPLGNLLPLHPLSDFQTLGICHLLLSSLQVSVHVGLHCIPSLSLHWDVGRKMRYMCMFSLLCPAGRQLGLRERDQARGFGGRGCSRLCLGGLRLRLQLELLGLTFESRIPVATQREREREAPGSCSAWGRWGQLWTPDLGSQALAPALRAGPLSPW